MSRLVLDNANVKYYLGLRLNSSIQRLRRVPLMARTVAVVTKTIFLLLFLYLHCAIKQALFV